MMDHDFSAAFSDRERTDLQSLSQLAPDLLSGLQDSSLAKLAATVEKGATEFPAGLRGSVTELTQVHIPFSKPLLGRDVSFRIPELAVNSFEGFAFSLINKRLLSIAGPQGRLLGSALSAAFLIPSISPLLHSLKKGLYAKSAKEVDAAGKELGDCFAHMVAGSVLGYAGYKAATAKQITGLRKTGEAIKTEEANKPREANKPEADRTASTRRSNDDDASRTRIVDVANKGQEASLVGQMDPESKLSITMQLKSKGTLAEMDQTLRRISRGEHAILSDADFEQSFGADPHAVSLAEAFARRNGLEISRLDKRSGLLELKAEAGQINNAFHVRLQNYRSNSGEVYCSHDGAASIPRELQGAVTGIFGLDNRPVASLRVKPGSVNFGQSDTVAYLPSQIASAYEVPQGPAQAKFAIAIPEFGGGIRVKEQAQYYKQHGWKTPQINVVEVGEGENAPWDPSGANGEVSLDSQVIGAVAPDLEQTIIFSRNDEKGFIDAVNRAVFQNAGETPNVAISISWGSPAERWSAQARQALNRAFKAANLKGISVYAASGDGGALDDGRSGKYTTTYPASDPDAIGCGGTEMRLGPDGARISETAWNGSGGGISEVIPQPDYQKDLRLPPNANGNPMVGRAVPDLAGNASALSPYLIMVDGKEQMIHGTSAVAPLMAAMTGNISSILGRPAQITNSLLYKNAGPGLFYDITAGDNGAYKAAPGYDPVTGLGAINGKKLLELCRQLSAGKLHSS